ncbi:MAG TPA: hypothetical protein VEI98_01040 [Xanthobacteraceae bacterium]|nr:hypothetical protein [Xanthobacteraceae bacterium]
MPHFYFHLSAPDEDFQDPIGADLSDICAAHSRAMLLADRVMMFSGFAEQDLDFRRWTVRVTDAGQNLLMTVLFPTHFPRGKWKSAAAEGVRPSIMSLDATLTAAASRRVPPRRAGTGLLQSGRP